MKPMEKNDPLWNLLGKSPLPQPEPWFAARTLARLRRELDRSYAWSRLFRWALGGAVAGLIVCAVTWNLEDKSALQTIQLQAALEQVADNNGDDLWQESAL
jgi:hypothetical protein